MKGLTSLAMAALLAGCSLTPDYERPASPVNAAWPTGPAYAPTKDSGATPAADVGWRDFIADPGLQALIAQALRNNRDLREAALNVDKARAQYRVQRADLLPTIDTTASDTWQRTPAAASTFGRTSVTHNYNVGLGVTSFELDLWGRVRSLSEQALQEYLSLDETRAATQISLVAEVANAYLTLLADQQLLRLTEDTLRSQQQSYELTRMSLGRGTATELELRQQETSVRTAEANRAQYLRQVAQDRNALELLVGASLPAAIDATLTPNADFDTLFRMMQLPAGLPSDLLLQRPDIRAAEHDMIGANANIGAARAAFFPTITLTGSGGTASKNLAALFTGASAAWSFSPTITLPIFDFGRNQANLDVARIQKNIQVARYEKAIQTAFREVADALAAQGTYDSQVTAQQRLATASAASYRLSEARYRAGVASYLDALVAQRSLYEAQQNLITTRLNRASSLVTLYKVLGGGWRERTATVQASASP